MLARQPRGVCQERGACKLLLYSRLNESIDICLVDHLEAKKGSMQTGISQGEQLFCQKPSALKAERSRKTTGEPSHLKISSLPSI
eukprot:748888-Hanusia_phi.AAC.4